MLEAVDTQVGPGPVCEGMAGDLTYGICLNLFCKHVTLTN